MFGKPIGKDERAPEDVVALKSLFGIRPGVYLAVLYGILIFAFLFALFALPGILKPGSLVSFDVEPHGAAVRVDGVYVGNAPCTVFVGAGHRAITFASPGFTEGTLEKEVGKRAFGSLFFPRREEVSAVLGTNDPVAAFALGAADYAAWTFAGEPTATYQVPLALSEAAYRSAPAARDDSVRARMDEVLRASARFAAYASAHRDLLRAKSLIDSAGLAPSPVVALRTGRAILEYLSNIDGASAWLASSLPSAAASLVASSDWYAAENAKAGALVASSRSTASDGKNSLRRLSVGQVSFREIPAGTLVPTSSFPRAIALPSFFLAENEVTDTAWAAFVAANPEWGADRKADLIERRLAAEGYLEASSDPAYPAPSMPGVSWYAATAFCDWLTKNLPPTLSDWEVRLPTEAEWERAARLAPPEIKNLNGGLWEWCADAYAPLDFLPASASAAAAVSSPERSIRGGSWANPVASVSAGTRASLPTTSCSPFVGFRPAIVRKTEIR